MSQKLSPSDQIDDNIKNLAKGLCEVVDKIVEQTEQMKESLPKPAEPGRHHVQGGGKPQ